jgi:acyl-CoA reductase-like NAD-dependent aldehyde dehydrogenase
MYFVDGEWRVAENNKLFDVYRPYNRALYAHVVAGGRSEAKRATDAAANAFPPWSQTAPAERAKPTAASAPTRFEPLRESTGGTA